VPLVARRLVFATLTALVAGALVAPAAASAATVTVTIRDRLTPAEVSVAPGTTVRWVNRDDERHRMRSQSGPAEFDSHNLGPGQSYSIRLTASGTYTYRDERDDENARYFGRIVVGGTNGSGGSGGSGGGTSGSGGGSGGGGSTGATAPTATRASVSMAGRSFSPATVTIAAGGSVTFRNDDDRAHTVTATDGAFDSGTIGSGASWKRTFAKAGTFAYLCAIHPDMTGRVVVKASTSTAQAAPKPTPTPSPTPAVSSSATPPSVEGAELTEAEIRDFAFAPPDLSVPVGSTVTWHNSGSAPHTVTAGDGSFDSAMIVAGDTWSRTFDAVGTFAYVCAFHPEMQGTVTVADAGPAQVVVPPSVAPAAGVTPEQVAAAAPPGRASPAPPGDAALDSVPVAGRAIAPDGELMARVGIVALLIGGAMLLFVRAVAGSANRPQRSAR